MDAWKGIAPPEGLATIPAMSPVSAWRAMPIAVVAALYGFGPAGAAEPPRRHPGPGNYQIDADTVTLYGNGPGAMEQTLHVDGATGAFVGTHRSAALPDNTNRFPGKGPVRFCVTAAGAAAVASNPPLSCLAQTSAPDELGCRSKAIANSFRQIDARTWEHTMKFEARYEPSSQAPTEAELRAYKEAMQRQLAIVERTASPRLAAEAREYAAMLRAPPPADARPVHQTQQVKERWTLLDSTCPAPR